MDNKMNIPNYFLRRMDSDILDKKFLFALNKCSEKYTSIKTNYPQSLTWFKNFVIATFMISLERMIELESEESSRKIQDSLMDYYADKIEKRWNELQEFGIRESITRILREETRPLKVMRRTHLIDYEINRLLDLVYFDNRICGRYDDADMFVRVVAEAVVTNLYFNTFYMMDDTSEEWEKSVDFIYDFIKDSHGETLKDYFNNMCSKKVEMDESELTERCWKGYTQKGMKTMFGKRYPNCVKKKKK
jgi:hypothetical protein